MNRSIIGALLKQTVIVLSTGFLGWVVWLPGATADGSRGRDLFERRCGGCHALDRDTGGPRLRGVYGRAAGSLPQFQYSEALKKAKITWNDSTLDQWLADPERLVPDSDMPFRLAKPEERSGIIAYLRLLPAK